ncbi:hypothetical protein SY88_17715 [Clostridiales bacterium PH28_bin88]|nr:hypothetical protein SY88_17715 [Clostridiales bacterium PH28_bin88]
MAWLLTGPNPLLTSPDLTRPRLVIEDQLVDSSLMVQSGEVLLPVDVVKQHIDGYLYWDPAENKLVVTTLDKVITMATDQLTAYINSTPVDLNVPVTVSDGIPYVPIKFFADLYGLRIEQPEGTNTFIVDRVGIPVQAGQVTSRRATIRQEPSHRSRGITRLEAGTPVNIYGEEKGWYLVRSKEGLLGYMAKKDVTLAGITLAERRVQPTPPAWRPVGEKISLVWEQVSVKTPDMSQVGTIPGVNVVSPTWFHLADKDGNVKNLATSAYVEWAHRNGYQVWALFASDFKNPDTTAAVLRSPALREKVIRQILAYAQLYNLDGINIDFENMHLADRNLFVQFVREMTPLLHEQGLTVSVDVTVKSRSENWSQVYDRRALGEVVDYVMLMAYDEYWASSPLAGPVSSLPWVEKGIRGLLEEVPANKLVLGIPFYTRLWEEKSTEDGKTQVSSRALSMASAQKIVKDKQALTEWDSQNGLNFTLFEDGGAVYKMWLEDEDSLRQRLDLVRQYGLAGVAAWRRGFEVPATWDQILASLNKFPMQKPLEPNPRQVADN